MIMQMGKLKIIIIFVLILGTACGSRPDSVNMGSSSKEKLTIFAAASLAEAFTDLGDEFESSHPGVDVVISFAGSQQIAQQLSQGAPADVFASADRMQMDNAILSNRVLEATDQEFVNNQLALVIPGDNPGNIEGIKDLARPGLRLILADEAVPVGGYSQQMLERANQEPGFGEQFKAKVVENVVSYEENVRAVLTKIILGEADAGIVYVSDAVGAPEADIRLIPIPDEINVIASYYIAPVSDSSYFELGQDFISFALSPAGQEILNGHGFMKIGQHE